MHLCSSFPIDPQNFSQDANFYQKLQFLAIFGAIWPYFYRYNGEIWHEGVDLGLPPQSCFDSLLTWSDKNDMAVNFNKTKEMVMGPPSLTSNLPLINTTTGHIERVNSTKLLGLYLDSNLTWHTHT